ncbi:hypothetical protein K502DRAFT_339290 [Neoconidiobolus thromboides FSU 785]|nr:hypothetical protein K502DRAFT_339290 [Neoconidiobolus thromboides FSU 785]
MAGEFVLFSVVSYSILLQFKGQELWDMLSSKFDSFTLLIIGSYLSALLSYFVSSFIFYIIDIYYPTNYSQYKIQKCKKEAIKDYKKALPVVLFNYVLITLPCSSLVHYLFHPISPRYSSFEQAKEYYNQVPTSWIFLKDLVICLLIAEIGFYYIHRLLHHPLFYTRFHKLHHEFTAPIGLAAVYVTVTEFVFSNLLPVTIGPLILRSHPLTIYFWLIFVNFNTVTVHSGYDLPYLRPAKAHDYHHEKFNYVFGLLGILDRLHKTDGGTYKIKK